MCRRPICINKSVRRQSFEHDRRRELTLLKRLLLSITMSNTCAWEQRGLWLTILWPQEHPEASGAGKKDSSLLTGLMQVQGGFKWELGVVRGPAARGSGFSIMCNKEEMTRMCFLFLVYLS